MGRRGPAPSPRKIQVDLKGDPSKRVKYTQEPVAPSGSPKCPKNVKDDPIAYAEWIDVCEQLDKMELLSTTDGRSLELYCKTYSRYREAESKVERYKDVMLMGKSNYPQVSPYYTTMNKYADELRKWMMEFSLTPAARARCRVSVDTKNKKDKWDGILKFSA